MKGVRFYQEFDNKAKTVPTGNVIALFYESWLPGNAEQGRLTESLSATFYHANSDVSFGGVADSHLRKKCKRVSEAKARIVHPRLFERMEEGEKFIRQMEG